MFLFKQNKSRTPFWSVLKGSHKETYLEGSPLLRSTHIFGWNTSPMQKVPEAVVAALTTIAGYIGILATECPEEGVVQIPVGRFFIPPLPGVGGGVWGGVGGCGGGVGCSEKGVVFRVWRFPVPFEAKAKKKHPFERPKHPPCQSSAWLWADTQKKWFDYDSYRTDPQRRSFSWVSLPKQQQRKACPFFSYGTYELDTGRKRSRVDEVQAQPNVITRLFWPRAPLPEHRKGGAWAVAVFFFFSRPTYNLKGGWVGRGPWVSVSV